MSSFEGRLFTIHYSRKSYSWIEPPVNKISQRVCNDVRHADDKHAPLDKTVIAFSDPVFQKEKAESLPAKNLFGNYRPSQQHAKLQTEYCHDGDKTVLQN